MSTYAIGDVQGCFAPLMQLLDKIAFNPAQDTVWFTGDLVNRGPQSLETLRFIKQLGSRHKTVLGNHDLHLLAVLHGAHPGHAHDTLATILTAPDKNELLTWLLQQPLLHHDVVSGFTMVHAGLAAEWDLQTAKLLATEIESLLQSEQRTAFFQHMYGNVPNRWSADLRGFERARCITNYFTRARFCHIDGSLELKTKAPLGDQPANLIPWFQVSDRRNLEMKIIFGHWAALMGVTHTDNVFAIDTGCVWGNCLTAMRLEDQRRFSVNCPK